VRIQGSAYRRPGAKLLVADDGTMTGNVSGGCLEADVRERALAVLRSGPPRVLHYDTGGDDQTVWGHLGEDSLVGWGWAPGAGRTPAPGTQKEFGALARAWADAGAHCPPG
jgi:hypothetical protein